MTEPIRRLRSLPIGPSFGIALLCASMLAPAAVAAQVLPPPAPDPYAEEGEDGTADDEAPTDEDEVGRPPPAAERRAAEAQPTSTAERTEDEGEDEDEDAETEPPGGTTVWLGPEPEPDEDADDSRLIVPPVYLERSGDVNTTAVFPFYFQRSSPEDFELVIPPYYYRRGVDVNADVLFPFYWSIRTVDSNTFSIPPFYYHGDPEGYDLGLAPLFFTGRSDESHYTVIPPLLSAAWGDEEESYTFIGPYWRIRDGVDTSWGIFPLLWATDDGYDSTTIAPPFFFRFVDADDRSALTIIPPVYHEITPTRASWGVAPLLLHSHDEEGFSWTVPPALFHYSSYGDDLRLVTPLFGYFDVDNESTLITPVYQNHRGGTELDAVFPVFWSWRDPRAGASALVIPPVLYHYDDPAETTTLAFPFFGRWHERGHYTTWATPLVAHYDSHEDDAAGTWVFPNIQFSHTPESSTFNLHPLVYSTTAETHRHLVLAPIYWDFEDYEDDSRVTIGFPLFWRFRNGSTVDQLALNTYYHYERQGGVPGWEFHFFPFFAYGEPRPGDHWWSILYGLAGYERRGEFARARAFWVPFQVDGPEGD